ncbi:hypothetical protein [Psychromonas sp. SR45-3]|uniref:hypothetical protein n=1 Tax=Psychromonas sp. SR45-3 TaxID=2760930 RepID=UPI0015FAD1DF|nr:hypothetical protein [Psychromonas sp. SR45-3]MBB1272956.1 hypothetical protein [Psychromonas sp. SR45-3]
MITRSEEYNNEMRFVPYDMTAIESELNHIEETLISLFNTFPSTNDKKNENVSIASPINENSFGKLIQAGVIGEESSMLIRRKNGFVILFNEPVYISSINFTTLKNLKVSNNDIDNELILIKHGEQKWESILLKPSNKINEEPPVCNIHSVVLGVAIPHNYQLDNLQYIPANKILNTDVLTELVQSYKTLDSHTMSALNRTKNFEESLNLKVTEKSSQLALLQNKINTLEDEAGRLKEGHKVKEAILNKLDKVLSDNRDELTALEAQKASKSADIKNKNNQLEDLGLQSKVAVAELAKFESRLDTENKKLEILNKEIRDAEKEKDLYSFNMKGFTKEARTQLRIYAILSAILIGILGYIFYEIYDNAKGFLDLIPTIAGKSVSMLDILLSRLPMITASTLIIGAFSALLYFLVNHIIALNKEKMLMLKAHILTEQLSGSLEEHCEQAKLDPILLKKDIKIEMIMRLFDKERNIDTGPKLDKNVIEMITKAVEEAKKSVK